MKSQFLKGVIRRSWLLPLIFVVIPETAGQSPENSGIREIYTRSDRVRSGIALGGIGTGSVELRKDGQFYNWTLMNNWPLGTGAPFRIKSFPRNHAEESVLFFLVRYQVEGTAPQIKLLQLNNSLSEGGLQSIDYYYPWMSAVDRIEYHACFPFTNLTFTDPEMPLEIRLEAFSPFIPFDRKNSSLPGAYFNFSVKATGEKPVKVFLVASLRNLVGYDLFDKYFITRAHQGDGYKGFTMTCGGMDPDHSSYGGMGLSSMSDSSSYYLGWEHKHPYYEKLLVGERFGDINDTEGRNREVEGSLVGRTQRRDRDQRCFSSIGTDRQLLPGEAFSHSFLLSWYFPNRYGAIQSDAGSGEGEYNLGLTRTRKVGHYYNNYFSGNEEVAEYLISNGESLRDRTLRFREDFYASSLDPFVLNQVNSHLNTFVTSSILTRKGNFAIREGMTPEKPWGPFGTIDVSLYGSSSIIALFPELQKSMMHAHRRIQSEEGEIHHGLQADVDLEHNGTWGVFHRIDLVPNYIQLVLRDYFWTGDREYLEAMWPSVKAGINYILTRRDEDGDRMPDMDGIMCSYDNFPMFGLASYIQSQWLAAMASVEHAAGILEDTETEKLAGRILRQGRKLMEERLWEGSYYMLSNDYSGPRGTDPGILTDQLVGQWVAHQSGLGHLLEPERVRKALNTVMDYSFREGFGLRNCTWPATPDLYPIHETDLWVDQANTCWTGVELAFASFLLYEGMVEEAEQVIRTVDERYRRSGLYWDHQEFGGHYYRPMSAWSILHGYLGLGIHAGHYTFRPRMDQETYTLFFAHGNGTAHYMRDRNGIGIRVSRGPMRINRLEITDEGISGENADVTLNGKPVESGFTLRRGHLTLDLPGQNTLQPGDHLRISFPSPLKSNP